MEPKVIASRKVFFTVTVTAVHNVEQYEGESPEEALARGFAELEEQTATESAADPEIHSAAVNSLRYVV